MPYIYPTSSRVISDSFQDHINRESVNPGVDYECATGTTIISVANGTVTDADGSPAGSGGRTIHVNHSDGTGADYLHLNALSVSAGDVVTQGQKLGYSGGSGNGSNTYYGPHLHISFRPNWSTGYGNNANQDFQAIMDSQGNTEIANEGIISEEDMSIQVFLRTQTDGNQAYYAMNDYDYWQIEPQGDINQLIKFLPQYNGDVTQIPIIYSGELDALARQLKVSKDVAKR